MHRFSRRKFLQRSAAMTLLGGAYGAVPGGRWASAGEARPEISPLGIADDLVNPAELRSHNGRLKAELHMDITDVTLPSGPAKLRIFNGRLPAPTLRLMPGDTLEVAFENRMPPNADTEQMVTNVRRRMI